MNAWKLAGWKEPVLEDKWDVQEVQLTMFVKRENVAVNVAHELTERQQNILDIIKEDVAVNVAVNTKYLSEKLGVNRKTIQRDLISLQAKNLVKWVGSDKDGHWELMKYIKE